MENDREKIIELVYLLKESTKYFSQNDYFIYLLEKLIISRIEEDPSFYCYVYENDKIICYEFDIDAVMCMFTKHKEKKYFSYSFCNMLNDKSIIIKQNLKTDINEINRTLFDIFD